jgi:hypothetical protein
VKKAINMDEESSMAQALFWTTRNFADPSFNKTKLLR